MLYSNIERKALERAMDFGTLYEIQAGESGRGRKLLALACPPATMVKSGMNTGLTIGKTRSGRPRINKAGTADNELFMLLSAQGGYTRRGCGTIWVPEKDLDKFEVLARGNGADGMAGRIGFWDVLLLHVPDGVTTVVRVRTSGAGYGTPSDLYVIHGGAVYNCHPEDFESCCGSLGIDPGCQVDSFESGWARL